MPGLCGLTLARDTLQSDADGRLFDAMLARLTYGRCGAIVRTDLPNGYLGCAHLSPSIQTPRYTSGYVTALFHGHLARSPGGDWPDGARTIHDLYMVHGEDFVHHLEGAFAAAIWDRRAETLLVCNDRLGLRPIYYCQTRAGLRFASELKALLADPALSRQLNMAAVACFFIYGYVMGEETFFKDVRLLPPGSLLKQQHGLTTVCTYWSFIYPDRPSVDASTAVERVYDAIHDAVTRALRPGWRYGIMLSGGMDSRWLAAVTAREKADAVAFTYGRPQSDDMRIAAQITAALGIRHICHPLPPDYLARQASNIVHITDGMYNVVHAHEFPLISTLDGEVDVLLGGFLGDLLSGRNIHPMSAWLPTRRAAIAYTDYHLREETFSDADLACLFGSEARRVRRLARAALEASFAEIPNPLNMCDQQNIMQRHRRFYYAAQLLKTPFVEMYHPFHDRAVLEVNTNLPIGQRFMQYAYLQALCHHFPELARIPWTRTSLPPNAPTVTVLTQRLLAYGVGRRLPDAFTEGHPLLRVQRRSTDYNAWFRGPLRGYLQSILLDSSKNSGLLHEQGVAKLLQDHLSERRNLANGLGLLLTFRLWEQLFWTQS